MRTAATSTSAPRATRASPRCLGCFDRPTNCPGVGYFGSTPGDTSETSTTNTHIRYIASTDDGATWSAPADLNPHVRKPDWAGMFASSGHGIQLASGRLVQPIVFRDGGVPHASNIYSDDHGATWHNGRPPDPA
ncbi:exo-alpha-sialidase [Actinomadura syzygii]|uniref:exo-alpha-sialidase n=1 Tax=Actinomadura syzygii TaxID=1427538 RepID=A0A5D0TMS4_9ACTN|nr:sialidase family protein [Actinomadura syzygii]TYC07581.1 exo-alpha-sialidase [Actinomadura syzygii]